MVQQHRTSTLEGQLLQTADKSMTIGASHAKVCQTQQPSTITSTQPKQMEGSQLLVQTPNDTMTGGAGDDTLTGGKVQTPSTGGAGADDIIGLSEPTGANNH